MQSYQSGDWIIHGCANCGIDTHVTHSVKGDDKVFVSSKVEVSNVKVKPNKYCMAQKFCRELNFIVAGRTVKLKFVNFYYYIAKILSCFEYRKI